MDNEKNFICSCYFYKNYFIPQLSCHVDFKKITLEGDILKELQSRGIALQTNEIAEHIKQEYERRINFAYRSLDRIRQIKCNYTPLHPHVYSINEDFFDKRFLDLVNASKHGNREALLSMVNATAAEKVWQIPVFKESFCDDFVEELIHFESSDVPKGRPNTMNKHGVLLNELGFDTSFLRELRVNYLSSIAQLLLPEWFGEGLDSHKAFTVKYKSDEDLDLSYHFDNAEITLNICLGRDFEEGSLYFGNMRTDPTGDLSRTVEVKHKKGYGVLHRGQHRHGAMPIEGDGAERHNLIIWMRASSVRNALCPMCNEIPKLLEVPGMNDGFTSRWTEVCSVI